MVLGVLGGMGVGVRRSMRDGVRLGRYCEGSAVMRGSAGNARLMGQMMYTDGFRFESWKIWG